MDEIGQEPRRYFSPPPGPRRWLTIASVAGLVAAIGVFGVTRLGGGRHGAAEPGGPSATASPGPVPLPARIQALPPRPPIAPGTVLLTCDSVIWSKLPDWRAGSVRVGPLWIVQAHQAAFARLGRSGRNLRAPGEAGTAGGNGTATREVEMLVHVDAGSTVVMRAAAGTSLYFQFLNTPDTLGDYQGRNGDDGYTFVPCPAVNPGYAGRTDFYEAGFWIASGRTASVEVLTSASARPVWLTLSAPRSPR